MIPSIEKFHAGRSMAYNYYNYYEFGNYRLYDETASRTPGFRVTYADKQIGFKTYYTDAVDVCISHYTGCDLSPKAR